MGGMFLPERVAIADFSKLWPHHMGVGDDEMIFCRGVVKQPPCSKLADLAREPREPEVFIRSRAGFGHQPNTQYWVRVDLQMLTL